MSVPFGLIAGAVIFVMGTLGKNKVEDAVIASSDEFTLYDPLFRKYGGAGWARLKAICMNESSLGRHPKVARGIENPSDIEGSKSEDGKSWGLMQMTIPTARDYDSTATEVKLNDPEYSIRLASKFVASLERQFPGNEEFIVKSYNQGAGNSRKEMRGAIQGYAQEYWERYQRNRRVIFDKQGV